MGMVFGSRRTCIEPDYFYMIADHDGYRERTDRSINMIGDIIVYKDVLDGEIIHVGIIIEANPNCERGDIELKVLSQFGADGEYIHDENDLPMLITGGRTPNISIWTEAIDHGR